MNKPDEKAPRFEKRKWTSAGHAMAALALAALLGGCGGGSRDGGFRMPPMDGGGTPTAPAFTGFQMKTLSSPAHLISGGDTLLELTIPEGIALDGVKLQLNGREAPAPLSVHDAGARTLRGLLSGLTTDRASPAGSANTLRVLNAANPSQYSEFSLVNYPITGPMLSGPHIQPYECRTVENELGKPLDADCSAATQLKWFYRTQDKKFKPLPELGGGYPEDMVRTTTNDGVTVPYIVRVESGTINRGVYRLAMLDDPTQASSPWTLRRRKTCGSTSILPSMRTSCVSCCFSAAWSSGCVASRNSTPATSCGYRRAYRLANRPPSECATST